MGEGPSQGVAVDRPRTRRRAQARIVESARAGSHSPVARGPDKRHGDRDRWTRNSPGAPQSQSWVLTSEWRQPKQASTSCSQWERRLTDATRSRSNRPKGEGGLETRQRAWDRPVVMSVDWLGWPEAPGAKPVFPSGDFPAKHSQFVRSGPTNNQEVFGPGQREGVARSQRSRGCVCRS